MLIQAGKLTRKNLQVIDNYSEYSDLIEIHSYMEFRDFFNLIPII